RHCRVLPVMAAVRPLTSYNCLPILWLSLTLSPCEIVSLAEVCFSMFIVLSVFVCVCVCVVCLTQMPRGGECVCVCMCVCVCVWCVCVCLSYPSRSEEHTSELQSHL